MTQQKSAPGACHTWERGRQRRGANVYPDCSKIAPACQAQLDAALVHLTNDDPDPQALRWSADLLDLARQALDKAARAELLADCCHAAGDVTGRRFWRRVMLRHQAVAWAATHPKEVIR